MVSHIENIGKILEFIVRETPPRAMIDILYEDVKNLVEQHIILRDIENFVAYFKFILSSAHVPKQLKFEPRLVRAFVDRTYAGFSNEIQEFRAERLYKYLKKKIKENREFTQKDFAVLEKVMKQAKEPSLEKVMVRVRIAVILKWLQGPLKKQLSEEMQDYIIFLATTYGQYQRDQVLNIEWPAYEVNKKDVGIIAGEYQFYEIALIDAIREVKQARAKKPNLRKYQDQFRVVIISLDNLIKLSKEGKLDSVNAFKDKIIVATTLIYVQDEFVEKDPELNKLIQLFISLYYKFRDKHYTNIPKSPNTSTKQTLVD
jgi:soluble cytochrome b562